MVFRENPVKNSVCQLKCVIYFDFFMAVIFDRHIYTVDLINRS